MVQDKAREREIEREFVFVYAVCLFRLRPHITQNLKSIWISNEDW